MTSQWKVFNIFFKEPVTAEDIRKIRSMSDKLLHDGSIGNYYYNKYSWRRGENYVRLGLMNPTEEAESRLEASIQELQKAGRVVRTESTTPDLQDIDGKAVDEIKCVSRELSDIVSHRFNGHPTVGQSYELIHLMMNQLCYSYKSELELYSALEHSIRIALRRAAFGDEWHENMEALVERIGNLAAEFNSRYQSERVFNVLEDLSARLGIELDSLFPRVDPTTGQRAAKTLESQMWALDMIVASWEAWLHKSKSIEHHGQPNPMEEALLEYMIWAGKSEAFNLGKTRAEQEKRNPQ
jgi:hypothetical protein